MSTTSSAPGIAVRLLRWVGWLCIAAAAVVVAYLVYSLLYTNVETGRAQETLLEDWEREVGAVTTVGADGSGTAVPDSDLADPDSADPEPSPESSEPDEGPTDGPSEPPAIALGDAAAVLQFHRPGAAEPPVASEPMFVVEGVTVAVLRRGPGHYPSTALPGQDGNFAVAGHRTTYGAPFYDLEELQAGDEIHVTDRAGARHVYAVRALQVVSPGASWVIGPDPLEGGRPTLTLTTCHPRFSNAERLVVFAELVA